MNVKTASTGSLTVLVAAALVSALMAGSGAADSIGTVYNMDRMLSEPHPLADQYGTRWQAPPASAPAYAPGAPRTPGATPSPFPATAPEPPPTTFAPPEPPPFGQTAPPQPAPQPQPVAKVTPVESLAEPATRPLEMAPRLSIDAEGVDLEPEAKQEPGKTEPEVMEKAPPEAVEKTQPEAVEKRREREFEQPGPRPPLPPG